MGLFGQALYDHYHNCEPQAFFVCNGQEEHQLDLGFYLAPKADTLEEALLAHAVGHCLDIGCGAGRILRYLRAKSYAVKGIDIDPQLIQLCRELGDSPVHQTSWETMGELGRFDTFMLLNRSIGIGGNLAGVKRLLARCAASASLGGVLLFDSYEISALPGVLEQTLRYKYRGQYSDPFPWIYFGSEIAERLLGETGWGCETVIRDGERYGVVARKEI
jgi:SAM-dependent methyltransferase